MTCRIFSFLIASAVLTAQPQLIEQGQKLFGEHCSGCHGKDAGGGEMGPNLGGTRRMRSSSVPQIRNIISKGMVSTGMPAFKLPAPQLDALAAFVCSLNATAAEGG